MNTELIAIREYCTIHQLDPSFVDALEEEGLIVVVRKDTDIFVEEEQLPLLETFTRWYVDMGINPPGIEVVSHLLEQLKQLHSELDRVKQRLRLYEE